MNKQSMQKIAQYISVNVAIFFSILIHIQGYAATPFGATFCHSPGFTCVTVKRGETWKTFAPNLEDLDLLQRINRMNIEPYPGSVIAVPTHFSNLTIYDVSPFPRYISPPGTKTIYVNQKALAWGAYDAQGNLIWWGPISPGKSFCSDIQKPCKTPDGSFYIQWKEGIGCTSSQFPVRNKDGSKGGASMPYCMHFWGGYALHGSTEVPGYAASHGCVRLFTRDAQWLNQQFINVPHGNQLGTHVIISEATP